MLIYIDSAFTFIIRKAISLAYHTLIPLILISEVSNKLKTSGMLNSNFELKSLQHDSDFAFTETILIHIDSALNILSKAISSRYLTLISKILISEGV